MDNGYYIKKVLTHNYNYFIAAPFVLFMFLTGNFFGWFLLFLCVETILIFSSVTSPVRRLIDAENSALTVRYMLDIENEIYEKFNSSSSSRPYHYRSELSEIRRICEQISKFNNRFNYKSMETKLAELRYKFASLLDTHAELSQNATRDISIDKRKIEEEIRETEKRLEEGGSSSVRATLQANLLLLHKRLSLLSVSGSRKKDIEARISLVKNSVQLLYEDICARRGIDDESTLNTVDSIVATLDVGNPEEFAIPEIIKKKEKQLV
jgi:hypothetical protein